MHRLPPRRFAPVLAAVALAALGAAPAPAAVEWRETGLSMEAARQEAGPGGAHAQIVSLAHAEMAFGARWEARLELSGSLTEREETALGPRAGAAALVRLRPHEAWLLQAGLRTPGGLRRLDAASFALAREVGEPLLALPDPEPARGLRVHAGAVRGLAFGYDWKLLLAAGYDHAGAVEVVAGSSLRPGDRFALEATLETTRWKPPLRARARIAREEAERLEGVVLRSARTLAAGEASAAFDLPPLAGSGSVGLASTGRATLPDLEIHGLANETGPALLGHASLELRPSRRARAGRGAGDDLPLARAPAWRPALTLTWLRLLPREMPLADGWSARVEPALSLLRGRSEYFCRIGWETGRLSFPADGQGSARTLSGWRAAIGVRREATPSGRAGAPRAAGG
ncbi:MAG: hypothetical protein FJY75_03060 [Candidatus Eisenbacteria bacterium]|uniref:DUF3187 family protein n=1 Tax=Eiseniibacteriota bacterium TaxID=2212470 RepID=A0A937XAC7_UNCEI|nr:hypothetical protein [Candidatus Eisenbacteria bacterium]